MITEEQAKLGARVRFRRGSMDIGTICSSIVEGLTSVAHPGFSIVIDEGRLSKWDIHRSFLGKNYLRIGLGALELASEGYEPYDPHVDGCSCFRCSE